MSDNEVPIQQWWPNYPNPVQMYLCWERGNNYQLVYNQNEIQRSFSLNSTSIENNPQNTRNVEGSEEPLTRRPPPSYSVAVRQKSIGISENLCHTEPQSSSEKPEAAQSTQAPKQTETPSKNYSNERNFRNNYRETQDMRPYKKRSFHNHLQSNESNMENENSEDSEKQASSSPPIEDVEKDKDKDGDTKRRKRWKRKISRKQFRHHDIKLFTPGEYKSTSLLKHKDSSPTIPKKPQVGSRESITDLIVTSLGGQKQVGTQKKGQMEEAADSTTKNDAEEENNNTNGIQNNNNLGKHNLPAIIMETPTVRRRSADNTNISKSNLKSLDHTFTRRMSVDMPVLNPPEKTSEDTEAQPQIRNVSQEQANLRINEPKSNVEPPSNINIIRTRISDMEATNYSFQRISEQEMHNLKHKAQTLNHLPMEQNFSKQIPKYNGHMKDFDSTERQIAPNIEPMQTLLDEQPVEPENLSLKRRHSGDNPVDLTKKTIESIEHRQKLHPNGDANNLNSETNKIMGNSYRQSNYQQTKATGPLVGSSPQTYAKNNISNRESISPKARHRDLHNQDQTIPHAILTDTLVKMTNLNMWQEVLQRLLKQSFTLQILDLMAHAYEQTEQAKNESSIPPELKLKAEKLLSETYSFISGKLKQLNLDVNPVFVIKILGQPDTAEKNTLKHYIENIERIRKLAIDDTMSPAVPKIPTSQFPLSPGYLQNYKELARSPPSSYSTHINQPQYHRNSKNIHLPKEPYPSSSSDHFLPRGHQGTGGHHMSPGYPRGPSPKTDNPPTSGGYSRQSSPKTGDHPMPMGPPPRTGDYSVAQRRSREPSPQTSDHLAQSGLPQRPEGYPYAQGYPRGQSPKIGDHPPSFGHPRGPPPRTGEYSMSQGNSRESSPRTGEHQMPMFNPGGAFLRIGAEIMHQGLSQQPSSRPDDHHVALEHTNESFLRTGKHYMAGGFTERPPARPLSYPRELQLQQPSTYNMNYLANNLNPNVFLTQTYHKESSTRSSGSVGRPRSKSHRNTDTKSGHQHHLKRSLSNPQHAEIENPLLHPYLEGVSSRMPPPRMPTSPHNFHPVLQPNNILPPPIVQNKELSVTPTAAPLKPSVPSIYSEVFYQNLHNHVAKGNPLAISVHPHPRTYQKKGPSELPNIHSLEINESHKRMPKVHETHQRVPEKHPSSKEPSVPLITSPTEAKISSSTDHVEISKVTNVSKQPEYEEVSLHDPILPKPTETLKSIPVAVIVADKSMQITKETTHTAEERLKEASGLLEEAEASMSVSSNSNEAISSSEENLRQAFDKEQEENNTEFLVWLEKLKSNEKLKSRFLSQMGIVKKEEPIFTSESDPIEIVDSDEEESSQKQRIVEELAKNSPNSKSNHAPNPFQESVKAPTTLKYNEKRLSQEVTTPTKISTITSNIHEVETVALAPKLQEAIRNSSPQQSLSKKDYIPPIPLPYIPSSSGQSLRHSPAPIRKSKKTIYSPEIEPISPVGNEPSFVFPDVSNTPKVRPSLSINPSDRGNSFPETVTSPTYNKRKNPLDFPAYQSDENIGAKTDYPNDSSGKRRKSLDRPEVTRSPRIAPSGKLCYVRESHMFLRYFDDTQVELFIRNLSNQDDEVLRGTGFEPDQYKSAQLSKFGPEQLSKTEIIYLPRDVEFSEKEDIPEVEEFIKETSLVEQFVPKDFADFYRYVTGFQIIKNKHPVSLQTFLTMYNTNRTSELLRKYLERDEIVSKKR